MSANTGSGSATRETADAVAWGDPGCDIVLECTDKFLKTEQLDGYFRRGVKRVIVAAPVKESVAVCLVITVLLPVGAGARRAPA
jgi:glyceraldehyde 3-phosphate dehydrogenase